MTSATWLVMFPKSRLPSSAAVLAALSAVRGSTVHVRGDHDYEVVVGNHTFDIGLNTERYVVEEAREAVEHAGELLPNRDEVATFDARFEIFYDLRAIGDLFGPMLAAADRLAALTGGITFEEVNGAFQ